MENKSKHIERTLVLLKPDVVQRGLIGEIVSRFEKKGLKIVAMKMVWSTEELANSHYKHPEAAAISLGEKTIASFAQRGIKLSETPMEIAKRIESWLASYLAAGPIVAMVLEGAHAVAHVRKMRGPINSLDAQPGTIIGDLTTDSYILGDEGKRSVRTMVHASGSVEEAEHEIGLWFKKDEIFEYKTAIEEILYSIEWEKKK